MLMPKRKLRADYVMVPEGDPQFARFWAIYPHRVSKKEARKAWAEIAPDAALVDEMIATLRWQAVQWATQGYGTPYPASWLRAERWTDEPPAVTQKALSSAVADPVRAWLEGKGAGS